MASTDLGDILDKDETIERIVDETDNIIDLIEHIKLTLIDVVMILDVVSRHCPDPREPAIHVLRTLLEGNEFLAPPPPEAPEVNRVFWILNMVRLSQLPGDIKQ